MVVAKNTRIRRADSGLENSGRMADPSINQIESTRLMRVYFAKLYEVWTTPGVIIVDKEQEIRFDLRDLPSKVPPKSANSGNHKSKAAFQAPYWAAEIRSSLDRLLED